jgi:hypothetical protein
VVKLQTFEVVIIKKKLFILMVLATCVGTVVYQMQPEPFVPDNSSGDFCPKCKSKNVGKYFYGLYREEYEDSATIAAVKESRLIPGGCVVDERCPRYRCNDCSYKWGSYR